MEDPLKNPSAEPFAEFARNATSQPQNTAAGRDTDATAQSDRDVDAGDLSSLQDAARQPRVHPPLPSQDRSRPRYNQPEPDPRAPVILECMNLTKNYGPNPALSNVSFVAREGGVVGLLGPNGSGKSTLIKLAMGMLQPTSGRILLDYKTPSPETKAFTAYLPDANYLCEWMTIDGQVKYCADFFKDFNLLKCEGLLSRLGLAGKQKIKTLSKGNKEKLGLILTMSRDARLYILDEPIAGVDPAARDFILDTVMTNRAEGSTIFLCTHLIADIEPILTHALFLNRGSIVLDKPVKEVYEQEGKTLDELFREVFRW